MNFKMITTTRKKNHKNKNNFFFFKKIHPNSIYSSLYWRSLICAHNLGFHNGFSICLYIPIVDSIFESAALFRIGTLRAQCYCIAAHSTISMQSNASE